MKDTHGIVYAYHSYPALNGLVLPRTSASLPFCSRYRLIDFALSSMTNAAIRDVGVIMHRNYQSLLDHLGSGKDWDLGRTKGGLKCLTPFGFVDSGISEYKGCMDALTSVLPYIQDIKQDTIVLYRGDVAVNLDLKKICEEHEDSGAELTAVCADKAYDSGNDGTRFIPSPDGKWSNHMHYRHSNSKEGLSSLEVYVIQKDLLVKLIDWSRANGKLHFHRDALAHYFNVGGYANLHVHKGYTAHICSVMDYYGANMDMLNRDSRCELFPDERPVFTKGRSSVSTYYGDNAVIKNSLVADGCYIEGDVEDCILFRGVRVGKDAKLRNCVILQDTVVGNGAELTCLIADKDVIFSENLTLTGNRSLPIVVPKGRSV